MTWFSHEPGTHATPARGATSELVSGHRLGTKEIESASLLVAEIAEAAVVPVRDEIKGRVPDLYVSLKPGLTPLRTTPVVLRYSMPFADRLKTKASAEALTATAMTMPFE